MEMESSREQLKRLEEEEARASENPPSLICLPAKKRIDSLHKSFSAYCLPAKKRIWGPHPLLTADDATSERDERPAQKPRAADVPDHNDRLKDGDIDNEGSAVPFDSEVDEDGIICSVCRSTDGDPSNPIVLCDGCELAVHVACYGDPLVGDPPEAEWFCLKCEFDAGKPVPDSNCCLCSQIGGAVKQTVDGRWAHITCALLVPEVFFRDADARTGIDCSRVPTRRWGRHCCLCYSATGCVIECSEPSCSSVFHVSCGLNEDLCIEYQQDKRGVIIAGFCSSHTEIWRKERLSGRFKIVRRKAKRERE